MYWLAFEVEYLKRCKQDQFFFYQKRSNMRTITIDIINEKVLNLLRDLELLKLIRLRNEVPGEHPGRVDWTKYKGVLSKQPIGEIDQQLEELRNEWE